MNFQDMVEMTNKVALAGMKAGQDIEKQNAPHWEPFSDPTSLTVRTLYFWRNEMTGDTFSQDPYLFSEPPLMQFVVPAPLAPPGELQGEER